MKGWFSFHNFSPIFDNFRQKEISMQLTIPETLTDDILARFATGEPRADIVTFVIKTPELQEQRGDGNISRARKILSDQLRSYDPTDRRFAEKYQEKFDTISAAIQDEYGERVQAFGRKALALRLQRIEEREDVSIELKGALDNYLNRTDDGGFEIADPQEAIAVINIIEKSSQLNIDDTQKITDILKTP